MFLSFSVFSWHSPSSSASRITRTAYTNGNKFKNPRRENGKTPDMQALTKIEQFKSSSKQQCSHDPAPPFCSPKTSWEMLKPQQLSFRPMIHLIPLVGAGLFVHPPTRKIQRTTNDLTRPSMKGLWRSAYERRNAITFRQGHSFPIVPRSAIADVQTAFFQPNSS